MTSFQKKLLVFYIFNSSNEWTFCSGYKFPQVDRGFLYEFMKYSHANLILAQKRKPGHFPNWFVCGWHWA